MRAARWRDMAVLAGLLACTASGAAGESPPETAWSIPWQLGPTDDAGAKREAAETTRLPGYGFVRGTPSVMRDIYKSLVDVPGRNEAVESCRQAVEKAATPLGAISVEAVSAGTQTRVAPGQVEAPVAIRVTYARDEFRLDYEVRQAILRCRIDRKGAIQSATVQDERVD